MDSCQLLHPVYNAPLLGLVGRYKIEIVPGDSSYVIASAEADTYERTRCLSGEIWENYFVKVADYEIPPIQAVGSDEEF